MSIAEKIGPRPATTELPRGVAPAARNERPLQLGEFKVGPAIAGKAPESRGRVPVIEVHSLRTSKDRKVTAHVSAGTEDDCTFDGNNCTGPNCNFAERKQGIAKFDVVTFDSNLHVVSLAAQGEAQQRGTMSVADKCRECNGGGRLAEADQKALDARAANDGSNARWAAELDSLPIECPPVTSPAVEKITVSALNVVSLTAKQKPTLRDTGGRTHGLDRCC